MTSPILADDATARALARALGSQYEVLRLLGRGGMGAVYLAREPFLERDVAVKVLPADMASGDARERFLREARTAARLSHPNIVPLYTFGQAGDLLYYVMGFVDGESLESRLKRDGRLTPEDTRRITSELADALDYAHRSGVVHRDVKPDNVLLDRATGRAMLTDFGIAKQRAALETLTQTGVIVGTPHYMSPEQASGDRDLDGRSDIYSLGVMTYRMATGRLPFEGSVLRDVLMQHATRDPVPPTRIIPSLPLDLDTVITRALAKEPGERWPNARAMRDALSPDSEEGVPEPLRNIAGMGTRMFFLSFGLAELAYLGHQFGMGSVLTLVSAGSALWIQLLAPLSLIKPARQYGWRPSLEQWFRQPAWWSAWWPRIGRRAGDVWDRLPRFVKRLRVANGWSFVGNVALLNWLARVVNLEDFFAPGGGTERHWFFATVAVGAVGFVGSLLTLGLAFRRRAKALGVSRLDTQRLLSEGTANASFWSRPHIAALLAPAGAARTPHGELPTDLVASIEQSAREETASPNASLFREAAAVAASIAAAIAHCDEELGQLARDADPRERERIESSLAALGPRAQESGAKTQMRELLEKQLQLLRELDVRREHVGDRRAHLHEQLRTLALHVAALRASADATATGQITGRIREIMREVDYRVAAASEVRAMMSN